MTTWTVKRKVGRVPQSKAGRATGPANPAGREMMKRIRFGYLDHQPAGGHGFRSGYWTVYVDNLRRKIFCSVPHAASLDTQCARVLESAEQQLSEEMLASVASFPPMSPPSWDGCYSS